MGLALFAFFLNWTSTWPAEPLQVEVRLQGIYTTSGASERDPTLDQVIFAAPLTVEAELLGIWLHQTFFTNTLIVEVGFSQPASTADPDSEEARWLPSMSVTPAPLEVWIDFNHALSIRSGRDPFPPPAQVSWLRGPVFVTASSRANWVKWSSIGALDFTILKDNLAGERPLPWKGKVYALKMLGHEVVAYGENGIAVLTPSGNAFGLKTISRIGLRNKEAVAGNGAMPVETAHYFVDKQAQLWELGKGLHFLDYSEFLSELVAPVLSYDPNDQLLYLCDGIRGFVYDPATKSLGRGPANIAGIGVQDGTKYVTAPATIVTPLFELTTDIYDLGTRRAKTIQSVECGVNMEGTMQLAIEYRQKIAQEFQRTAWYTIDSRAVKPLNCYGYEFRFSLRALAAGWFHLDYLRVNGHVHAH